jgi:sacsin
MVNQVGWEGWLTAAFYKQAAVAALFRVSGDTPWSVLSTTRSLPKELQSVGDALIAENFLPIPHPPLPDHIRNGFSINKIGLPKLTPDDLRIRLNEQRDVDCPIETAPRACLRKREYIKQILRFCLSDSPKKGIYGLPLVIDYRGHIRTAGLTKSPLYLMGQPWDLEVFSDHPEWFVDPSLLENLNQAETKYVGLPSMDSKCFVSELSKYIAEKAENGEPKMSTGTAGTLTDAWLQAVFSRLLESDLDKLKNEIIEIPLIPDQFHVLRPMGYASTPLLFRGHNEDLKRALAALSVPLITDVSSKLFNLLIDFSAKKGLIWQVTPCDLVDTLAASCSEAIRKYDRITDVQRAILDYLSRDESLADRKKFTERQNKLKSLRLFPTSKGDLVDLSSTTYVSQNFDSPQVDLKEVILDCGKSNQWRNLYILLGARELSRSCLIRELLLPGFEQLDDAARVKASAWLRDNLNIAQGEDETDDSDGLFDDVRNTPFIVCDDGELRAPMSVYQPESELARTVLGDQAAFPDMDTTYTKSRERWLGFFRQLKMPTEPRLSDVVKYVRKLIANTSYDHKADRFQAVYEFIKGKADAEIQAKNDVSDELSETLEELADIAWIPVRQEAGSFLCFQPAEAAFARPGDVYFRRNGQLVASQACITILKPEPNKLTCKAMGFPVKPPIALVVRHFKEVLAACSTQETMPNESVLVRVLGQIYRFFGGKAPGEVDELDEDIEYHDVDGTVDLKAIFSGIPCIWDQKNKCFWQPDHVFADNVLYMEPWRRTIWSSEDAVERGYDALGRRQSSTIEDWKQVLEEISRSDIPLSNEVADVIREAINHIVKELVNREATDGEVLVPTRNGTMLPARTVFIADAPWYESKLDSWDIPILSSSVSSIWEIHHVLNIPSLYDSIKERLREYPTESELPDKCRECSRLEDLLRSYEFILGLQRLLQHEGHYVSYSISYLHDVQVRCVKDIKTCLYLQFDGTERLLGDAKAEFYWDPETPQAMLTENRHRYFCDDLAEMLNRVLGDDGLKNLAPLIHMLQCKPSEISGVLDDLKIRKYSFNLEEEPEDEGEVTPQEFPDDDNEGMDQNEGGKTEDSKAFVSDGDEFLKDNGPEEVAAATDNSEQGGWSGQPYGVSTATSPRRPENGQPEDNSKGWPLGSVPGSSTPSGARASGSGHSIAGRSDMERAQSADVANDSSRQSTSSSHQPSAQRRLLSYVLHGNLDGYWGDTASGDDSRRLRIGEAAVEIVIDYEKRSGRKARSMAHSNPGYDVISEGDGETRYIEVKGTEVAWGERGVMLTPTQFFYARENPDRDYWLYVVEDVFSRNPQIHKIHNPSEKVDNFVFDGGWRQTVESAEGRGVKMSIPSPGDEVLQNGNVVGVVETILEAGKFPLVIYRAIDRSQQRKLLADITVRSKEKK